MQCILLVISVYGFYGNGGPSYYLGDGPGCLRSVGGGIGIPMGLVGEFNIRWPHRWACQHYYKYKCIM